MMGTGDERGAKTENEADEEMRLTPPRVTAPCRTEIEYVPSKATESDEVSNRAVRFRKGSLPLWKGPRQKTF